jgi:hypothetical protein
MLARELRPGRGGLVQSGRNRASAGSAASELAKPMVYTFGRRLVLWLPDTATQRETCWQRPVARAPRRPGRTRPAASLARADDGIRDSSVTKASGPLPLHRRVRWRPPGRRRMLGAPTPTHRRARYIRGPRAVHRRFTRAGHTRACRPERRPCRPGCDRPARVPWQGWVMRAISVPGDWDRVSVLCGVIRSWAVWSWP